MNTSTNNESENLDETIEQSIISRVKNFFDLNKKLKFEQLNDFLESISLSDVFGSDEEKEIIWTIFSEISNGAKEIDYETCKKGMIELFAFYGISSNSMEETEIETEKSNNNNIAENNLTFTPNKTNKNNITSFRESLQNKEKKLDELLTRISLMNTPSKIPHYNTPINTYQINDETLTKMFTAIEVDKLQQLRKVFSLLDLRNKEHVYISELQEVITKYKFIKLTQDELINFLSLISNDLIQGKETPNKNSIKLSINFELYSRAISIIEQQLLQHNSDTFIEQNDSYEINENLSEMIEEINNSELENVDYIMVLADLIKSLGVNINNSIVNNYEKILSQKFNLNEDKISVTENIKEGIIYYKNKLKDMEIFLKEMNQISTKKQNKLEYLKIVFNRLENNLQIADEDYRNLFQKFNSTQPIEINDETEKLFEENKFLLEQKSIRENQINILHKEVDDKDEQIFNLQSKFDKLYIKENDTKNEFKILKIEFDQLKKNYDVLLNDIYEKIKKEEVKLISSENDKLNNSISSTFSTKNSINNLNNANKIKSQNEKDSILKLKEKLNTTISEADKKILDMNYEQLILYTLKVENLNKKLEDKNNLFEKKLREMEKEIEELNKNNSENSKNVHLLKSENMRLQNKINDLNKDIEINSIFRPSQILGNRISVSRRSDLNTANINVNRFEKMQKIFELDKKENPRISQMNLENIQVNKIKAKLTTENVQSSQITFNPNPNNTNNTNNNKSFKINETVINNNSYSITNPNQAIFSQKDSFSLGEKFLFDDKNDTRLTSKNLNQTDANLFSVNYFDKNEENQENLNLEYYEENEGDKEYIVDCMEDQDNPFSSKNDEDTKIINQNRNNNPDYNLNDSVEMKAIARHSPFDIDVNSDKRKKLKNLSKENLNEYVKNTTIQSLPIINSNKKLIKMPSMITEELLEEDLNGDLFSHKEIRVSTQSTNLEGNNLIIDEKKNVGHNRGVTLEDIGLVFNKDSQFMCYDFLTLRKTEAIIQMFEDNREDVSSYEMFSDNIYLIDENNKKSKKYLFITSNFVYILRPYDLSQKTRINLMNLDKLTISNKNCNLIAFHFKEGDDILIEILRRMELLYFFRDLYRMKRYGKLKFKYSDNFKIKRNNTISNIIVDQSNNFFIAPNFDGAQKLGYLSKLTGIFFNRFHEKLVVLTNVGLLYFDDPNKAPKKLVAIIGSDITRLDEKKYKKKHCFEIKTLNGESYVFATNSKEELESWMCEFKIFKKNYEKKIKNIDPKK